MEIETTLQEMREKRLAHIFSEDDAKKILNLAAQYPCNLDVQLLLIEYAHYEPVFSQSWAAYAKEAIEKCEKRWKAQELAEVYLLTAQLYFYDQKKQLEKEATIKAFELAPDNWKTITAYLGQCWEELSPHVQIELTECISKMNPENPRAYYIQAGYFEEYASQSGENKYRDAAISAYQKSLDMGMDRPYGIPSHVVKDAIKRLRRISNSLSGNQVQDA